MFQIIIAEFKHETNTFSIQPTGLSAYKHRLYAAGDEMVSLLSGTATEAGGALDILGNQPDINLIPVISADAMPAGPVTAEVYDEVSGKLIQAIQATGKVDGVLLCLHGAMVTENSEDGEGDLIEQVRKTAGKETIIIATLDLHANITLKMRQHADVLINYDFYPHTDMYERGQEAAQILLRTLRGEIRPVMVCASVPIILPPLSTYEPVMKKFVGMVHACEVIPGVQTVSIAHGFPCADIHEMGMTVVAVTDNDRELASRIAAEIAAELWHDRFILKPDNMSVSEAIEEAEAMPEGPVILADLTDNPGGGSTCD
ncbi:MAG: M81 family metallopeptidase, partial [Bacillota bacterium]|nr:M81 family metallopeptidase [Bacillota bacterium]